MEVPHQGHWAKSTQITNLTLTANNNQGRRLRCTGAFFHMDNGDMVPAAADKHGVVELDPSYFMKLSQTSTAQVYVTVPKSPWDLYATQKPFMFVVGESKQGCTQGADQAPPHTPLHPPGTGMDPFCSLNVTY